MSALKRKSIVVGKIEIIDPKKLCLPVPVAMTTCAVTFDILLLIFQYIRSPFLVSSVRVVSKAWKRTADHWTDKWFIPWLCQLHREYHTKTLQMPIVSDEHVRWLARPDLSEISALSVRSLEIIDEFDLNVAFLFAWNNEAYIFSKFVKSLGYANVSNLTIQTCCYQMCMLHDRPDALQSLKKMGLVHADRIMNPHQLGPRYKSLMEFARECIEKQFLYVLRLLLAGDIWNIDRKQKSELLYLALKVVKSTTRCATVHAQAIECARAVAKTVVGKMEKLNYHKIAEKKDKCLLKAWEFLFTNPDSLRDPNIERDMWRASKSIPKKSSIHFGMLSRNHEASLLKLLPDSQETLTYDREKDVFVDYWQDE